MFTTWFTQPNQYPFSQAIPAASGCCNGPTQSIPASMVPSAVANAVGYGGGFVRQPWASAPVPSFVPTNVSGLNAPFSQVMPTPMGHGMPWTQPMGCATPVGMPGMPSMMGYGVPTTAGFNGFNQVNVPSPFGYGGPSIKNVPGVGLNNVPTTIGYGVPTVNNVHGFTPNTGPATIGYGVSTINNAPGFGLYNVPTTIGCSVPTINNVANCVPSISGAGSIGLSNIPTTLGMTGNYGVSGIPTTLGNTPWNSLNGNLGLPTNMPATNWLGTPCSPSMVGYGMHPMMTSGNFGTPYASTMFDQGVNSFPAIFNGPNTTPFQPWNGAHGVIGQFGMPLETLNASIPPLNSLNSFVQPTVGNGPGLANFIGNPINATTWTVPTGQAAPVCATITTAC